MDHVTIEAEDFVERYLLGRLSPADVARFEEHYLDCPECLEKLELTRALRQGLKAAAAEDGARVARTALLASVLRRGRALKAALAVVVLAVAVLPWAWLAPEVARLSGERERLAGELARALSPQVRTPIFSLSPERSGPGEEPSTRITLRPTPEWVVLALELPPFQSPARCRIRLREAGGEPLWTSGPLEPEATGRVTLSVHSSWLVTTDYVVELDALEPGEEPRFVSRFVFRVRREEE